MTHNKSRPYLKMKKSACNRRIINSFTLNSDAHNEHIKFLYQEKYPVQNALVCIKISTKPVPNYFVSLLQFLFFSLKWRHSGWYKFPDIIYN